MDCSPPGSSVHEDSPGKNTGVGCHAFLQGIFPTQGSNPGLPHCVCISIYLCIYIYIYIHPLVDEHFYFQFLAIANKIIWKFMYKTFYGHMLSFFLDKYLWVEWLDHKKGIGFTVQEIANLFQNNCTTLYSHQQVYKSSSFSASSPTLVIVNIFKFSNSSRCKVISHCCLNFNFPK